MIDGKREPPCNWRTAFGGPTWTWDEGTQQVSLYPIFLDPLSVVSCHLLRELTTLHLLAFSTTSIPSSQSNQNLIGRPRSAEKRFTKMLFVSG